MSPRSLKLAKHKRLTAILACKTNLHIGGSKDDIEIGGLDSPVIRDQVSGRPYIPGSSLKGKLRSLLEYSEGKVQPNGNPCNCARDDCLVCTLFGPHLRPNHELGPTRIIVRDAHLAEESLPAMEALIEQGLRYTAAKTENMINRKTGTATNPRTQEIVPAGAKFDLTIHLRVFEGDPEADMVKFIQRGLEMLKSEYLGGSGTRGYGWVAVENLKIEDVP
ncbi:MAG: type III-A CRISPR-associated RAMP protein Csm3 [Chloroflexi bacterium]|nr:type III-A CRISPR-associated RAMP protein Csm3 [Chloroflexota bacterium]